MSPASGSNERPVRIAIVGSGPSGFYTVAALFKQEDVAVSVDVFERLPVPYGLVRGGVAPDHQNIKAVIRIYEKQDRQGTFRFFGNVAVGRDLPLRDLTRHYDAVVLAVGNESHRPLGIPGEGRLSGVFSASQFVGWYNGHPDFGDCEFPLARARRVAVVGNGNVAMDVARILARDPEELAATDIASYALEELRRSAVEEIVVLGRRGPAEAAFSTKEIKELGSLENADLIVAPEEIELDPLSARWLEEKAGRTARDNVEYLREQSRREPAGKKRRIVLRFLVSPIELLGTGGVLQRVRLERNELHEDAAGVPRPHGTGETWVEEFQMLLSAVGYRGKPLPGLPFDEKRGILPNQAGRIVDMGGEPLPGLYTVGWAKGGPRGLIGSNVADAAETVGSILDDVKNRRLPGATVEDREAIPALLEERSCVWVSFEDWRRLDAMEIERGKSLGKIREKFHDVDDMLEALGKRRKEASS